MGAGTAGTHAERAAHSQSRPNIVVVMTDDQTVEQLRVMEQVRHLIREPGTTFTRSFVNFPLCCPSRATFLTGQYAHNHGVGGNHPPRGGFSAFDDSSTLATWLRRRGYRTALVGKYLNDYPGDREHYVPPGWTEWYAGVGPSTQKVYRYRLNENGRLVRYGSREQHFKGDVLTAKAVDFVERRVTAARPFFLFAAYTAPHAGGPDPDPQAPGDCRGTAKPAPRHEHAFDAEPLPKSPSFDERDVSDKPKEVRQLPRLTEQDERRITRRYRCRLESLLSVDEGVARIVDALGDELDSTYLFFTSDNGFFGGEHRIPSQKGKVYEEASRVPLLARGPAFPPGRRVSEPVINADLAPTIARLAGARPRHSFDGTSLVPIARHPGRHPARDLLIENSGDYAAVRTPRYLFALHKTGERELYDMHNDPHQLRSKQNSHRYADVERRLLARLRKLRHCAGAGCR